MKQRGRHSIGGPLLLLQQNVDRKNFGGTLKRTDKSDRIKNKLIKVKTLGPAALLYKYGKGFSATKYTQ